MKKSLRPWVAGIACTALAPVAGHADTAEDLAALRAEIAALKQDYAERVSQLEARIEELEATSAGAPAAAAGSPAAMAAVPADTPPAGGALPSGASAFNPAISVILTGTYANLSQDPATWAIAGFIPGGDEIGPGERSFSLGESEVTFAASVDPYFSASLTAALSAEGDLGVEEAFFRTTGLPSGFTLKGGRFFSGIGYLNEIHAHAWDFVDQPLAYQAFFGGQLAQDGLQVKWLAPTDVFLEFGAEAGNGNAFPATREGSNDLNSVALFTHVGGDIGDSIGWRAGLSWIDADATGREYADVNAAGDPVTNAFTGQSRTWIADATLKWAPGGDARARALELKAEYLQREEEGRLAYDLAGANLDGAYRSRQDGWYAQAVYRFAPRWRAGLRYDALDSGDTHIGLVDTGMLARSDFPLLAPATPSRITLMADWSPSEFSRLRAQYAWDDARDGGNTDEQWLLQYIHAIGAHGAHKF
ncbi:MAG TPA: hypothetical protein VF851_06535 [Steroidobacteraceae bacterium]